MCVCVAYSPTENSFEEAKRWVLTLRDTQWNFDTGCGNAIIIVVSKGDSKVGCQGFIDKCKSWVN